MSSHTVSSLRLERAQAAVHRQHLSCDEGVAGCQQELDGGGHLPRLAHALERVHALGCLQVARGVAMEMLVHIIFDRC